MDYDRWAADMTEDVPFYVELAKEADGPVVELAVGTGRVAIPVARATGRTVVGIDSSPAMLEQARDAGGDLLDLRLGDMRDFELEEPAALVYCPFRALLHLPTWTRPPARLRAGRGRVASRRSLRLERVRFRPRDRRASGRPATGGAVPAHAALRGRRQPGRHRARLGRDAAALWWSTRNEWLGLVEVAGLEVEALYGWFDRRPYDNESREMVWVARKPA